MELTLRDRLRQAAAATHWAGLGVQVITAVVGAALASLALLRWGTPGAWKNGLVSAVGAVAAIMLVQAGRLGWQFVTARSRYAEHQLGVLSANLAVQVRHNAELEARISQLEEARPRITVTPCLRHGLPALEVVNTGNVAATFEAQVEFQQRSDGGTLYNKRGVWEIAGAVRTVLYSGLRDWIVIWDADLDQTRVLTHDPAGETLLVPSTGTAMLPSLTPIDKRPVFVIAVAIFADPALLAPFARRYRVTTGEIREMA